MPEEVNLATIIAVSIIVPVSALVTIAIVIFFLYKKCCGNKKEVYSSVSNVQPNYAPPEPVLYPTHFVSVNPNSRPQNYKTDRPPSPAPIRSQKEKEESNELFQNGLLKVKVRGQQFDVPKVFALAVHRAMEEKTNINDMLRVPDNQKEIEQLNSFLSKWKIPKNLNNLETLSSYFNDNYKHSTSAGAWTSVVKKLAKFMPIIDPLKVQNYETDFYDMTVAHASIKRNTFEFYMRRMIVPIMNEVKDVVNSVSKSLDQYGVISTSVYPFVIQDNIPLKSDFIYRLFLNIAIFCKSKGVEMRMAQFSAPLMKTLLMGQYNDTRADEVIQEECSLERDPDRQKDLEQYLREGYQKVKPQTLAYY